MVRGTIGVLGGMGPLATVDFLRHLVDVVDAPTDQDHPATLVVSDPSVPDRSTALLGLGPSPLPRMRRGIETLCAAGASLIVIPCNSAHAWFEELESGSTVPLLHIADVVVRRLGAATDHPRGAIGVLATPGTQKEGLYTDRLVAAGWQVVIPSDDDLDRLVAPGIACVKGGRLLEGEDLLRQASERLAAAGAQRVVVGCTDISVVLREEGRRPFMLDSNRSLAMAAAEAAGARLRAN